MPVLCANGVLCYKEVAEICEDDYLLLKKAVSFEYESDSKGYLTGLYYGDGSVRNKGAVLYFSMKEHALFEHALKLTRSLGWYRRDYVKEFRVPYRSAVRVIDLNREAREYFDRFVGWPKLDYLSDEWLESSSNWKASFVKGLYDADGGYQGRTLSLASVRVNFVKELQHQMLGLGIVSHRANQVVRGFGVESVVARLNISGNSSYANFRKIGLTEPAKREKLYRSEGVGSKDKQYPKELSVGLREGLGSVGKQAVSWTPFLYDHWVS